MEPAFVMTTGAEEAMPTAEEIRALEGSDVSIRLAPQAGGESVEGRLVGTLAADDGLVGVVEPRSDPGRRLSYNYQHIAAIERREGRPPRRRGGRPPPPPAGLAPLGALARVAAGVR